MKIDITPTELFKITDFGDHRIPGYFINRGRAKYVFWKDIPCLVKNHNVSFGKGAKAKLKKIFNARMKTGAWPHGITFMYNPGCTAFTHQSIGMEYLIRKKTAILADDVGLGKTLIFCGAITYLLLKNLAKSAIIVTRASVKYQIQSEIIRFFVPKSLPENDVIVIDGTADVRYDQWSSDAKIKIANYEQVRNDYDLLSDLQESGHSLIDIWVLDEASKIKNRSTKIAETIKDLSRKSTYRWAVTATPIENGLTDLLSIAEFVESGIFPSKAFFDRRFCRYKTIRTRKFRRFRVLDKRKPYKNLDKAKKRLRGYYIRRTINGIGLVLPPILASLISLDPTKEQKKLYDHIKENYPVLSAVTYARMACNSPRLLSDKLPEESPKTKEIMALLDGELASQQVIIATQYVEYIKLLIKTIKSPYGLIHGAISSKKREKIRKAFQAGEIRIILMSDAGEYGLNLQSGSVIINADLPWNPARLKQRIGRICRLDTRHDNLRVINLVIKDTIEERIVKQLKDKELVFEKIFEKDGIEKIGNPIKKLGKKGLKALL